MVRCCDAGGHETTMDGVCGELDSAAMEKCGTFQGRPRVYEPFGEPSFGAGQGHFPWGHLGERGVVPPLENMGKSECKTTADPPPPEPG